MGSGQSEMQVSSGAVAEFPPPLKDRGGTASGLEVCCQRSISSLLLELSLARSLRRGMEVCEHVSTFKAR